MEKLFTITPEDKWGEPQARGRLLQEWLDGPDHPGVPPCPYKPTKLTANDLTFHDPAATTWSLASYEKNEGDSLGLLTPGKYRPVVVADVLPIPKSKNSWQGIIADGAIWLEGMFRTNGPHASEITQAVYEQYYPMNTLKYILPVVVINTATEDFIHNKLHTVWPDPRPDPRDVWEYDTPEYQALLGLPIGIVAAALLLSAFPRGTVRIARIHTWMEPQWITQMRLEVEYTLPKATRDQLTKSNIDPANLDTSDVSDAPDDLEGAEMSDSSGLSDPPSSIDEDSRPGHERTVSQGKRKADLPPDSERRAKMAKLKAKE